MSGHMQSLFVGRFLQRIAALPVILIALALAACGGGGYDGGNGCDSYGGCPPPTGGAGAPSVTLTAPSSANRTVTLTATPAAPNGVMRVDFLVDGSVIGMATAAPYSATWNTGTFTDGAHSVTASVIDSQNQTASSAATSVTVTNNLTLTLALVPGEEFPVPTSNGTGAGQLAVNLSTGAISGNFTLTGLTATAAHIHDAYAGNNGGIQIGFVANGTVANRWDLPANSVLTAAQVDRLMAGALYVNAHSVAFPGGEIRSQIKPANIQVVHANMAGTQEVPSVATAASGVVAVTVDSAANRLAVHVKSTGVDTATSVGVYKGATGATAATPIFPLTKDNALAGHWSLEGQALTANDLQDFSNSLWYANALTPVNPTGEIRGQISTTSAPAVTLSQLQTSIFTPRCTGCHAGAGAPQGLRLDAGNAYANLVNVASGEQPALKRVNPSDAATSYIIHKLEGAGTITGSRMPLGGPFLDQPTIDMVKAWINAGALNN